MMQTLIYVPLYNILIFFYAFVRDMGVAIILLTILVRLLLIRQSVKQEKANLALQKLQPEIEAIKKKYKDDKEKQTKATLELYQQRGINPFASCLPLLIQFPFLIGLFRVFSVGLKDGFPIYDFLKGLVSNVTISSTAFGFLDLTKAPNTGILLALPIIATIAQFVQMKLSLSRNKGATSSTGMIMYLMPALTLWFTISFPSALSLYWIATTLFAIGQQIIIDQIEKDKTLDELEPIKEIKEAK